VAGRDSVRRHCLAVAKPPRLRQSFIHKQDAGSPKRDKPEIGPDFDADRVAATVKAIQRGEIGYAEFLRRIMGAGCSHYEVYIDGRKAMYFGRDGEFYTEPFPARSS
jgi:uncharacterized protein YbcV (DUF1398 family)